jgi:hypothetical protein
MGKDNKNKPQTIKRQFLTSNPFMYMGEEYPSTNAWISDGNGNETEGTVFADANGQYYTTDSNGNAMPVMPVHTLDEVTVTAPKKRRTASDYFGDYLTMSNDATKVLNVPHRDYNTQLTERAIRGAKSHAVWEKEHPNLAAWSYAAGAAPFAVAAYPLAAGLGDAAMSTAAGQTISNGLIGLANAAKNNTFLPWLDAAATSYFGAKGLQDIQNGNFTPETALEVIPLGRAVPPIVNESRHLATNINDYNNINNFIERYGYTEYKPKLGLIFDDEKLDRLTNQLVKQHNRFVRGVSVAEARKYYGFPEEWTDEQIAEYTLTHPHIPSEINSGGNIERKPVLYTSNSIDLAKQYTDGNGYVGILQRPIIYDSNRSKMLELNDFRFNRLPKEVNNNFNPSITTDEPYIARNSHQKSKLNKYNSVKGGIAYKKRGKVVRTYSPVSPTFLDAQANAGSYMFPTQSPYDRNFRHFLFYGDPDEEILGLEKLIKYTKPEGAPSVDYKPYSIGFSKKKALGGKL